jgi:Mrp family chromosome partitioning ATPase
MLSGGLLSIEKVRRLLDLIKDRADLVLFDSAPVLAVSDNLILASMVDGVILVIRAGHTQQRDLIRAKELLERVNASLLGVVINEVSPWETRRYYRRYLEYYVPAGGGETLTPSEDRPARGVSGPGDPTAKEA